MPDDQKTKDELIEELNLLRARIEQIEQKTGSEQTNPDEKSENTLRMVFDNAPDGMLLADAETMILQMANDAICDMLGYSRQELLSLKVEDIHPANDLSRVVSQFEKLARREMQVAIDIPVKRKDGSVFHADVSASATILSGRSCLMGIFRDVTERKNARERDDIILKTCIDGFWLIDIDGHILEVNEAYSRMSGYSRDELLAMTVRDVEASETPQEIAQHIRMVVDQGAHRFESRQRRKDGTIMDLDISAHYLGLGGGRVFTFLRDITERRNTEQALRQSEKMLRSIIDHSGEVFYVHDTEHTLTYVSPQSREIFGYTPEEMMVKWTTLTTDNPINDEGFRLTSRAIETGERQASYVLEVKRKDGALRMVEINESPVKDENGNVVAVTGGLRDVTERRQAERGLQQSEEKYRTLITNIPDVIWTSDFHGNSTYISPNVEQIYGYTPLEIREQRHDLWLRRVHPDDLQRVERGYRELFEKGARFDVEYRIRRRDGQWIWLHDRSIATYEKDGEMYADGIFSDVTARKAAEAQLRESRANLTLAQKIAHVGSWEWNLETDEMAWSDETFRLFGFDPAQVEPALESFLAGIHPEDREFVRRAFETAASEGQHFHLESRVIRPDGVERVLDSRGQILRDSRGKPLRMMGVAQDITERRMSEQRSRLRFQILECLHLPGSLKDTCDKALSLIKAAMDCEAVALRMKEGNDYPCFVNDGFSQEFVDAENRLLCLDREGVYATGPDDAIVLGCMCGVVLDGKFDPGKPFFTNKGSFWTNSISSLMATTTAAERCGAACSACNEHGYESVALVPIASNGQIIGLLQISSRRRNVFSPSRIQFLEELTLLIRMAVEHKKAEQALQQSEEKFRRIAEQGFDVVLTADLDGTITYASPSVTRAFGYRPDEMIGRNAADFTPESGMPDVARQFSDVAEGRSFSEREIEIRCKDGSLAVVELNAAPIRDGDRIIGAQASARDITERRRVESALRESEEKYRTLVESAGESIASIDADGKFLFMNTTAAERVGGKPEDYIGHRMWDLFPKEIADRQMASVRRVIDSQKGINVAAPTELLGQSRWYNTTIEPLTVGGAETPNAVMMIARDIHDMKLAEEELARYREKMAHADRLASLGTLSATVAHELTQPLTVVRLTLDNLLDDLRAASCPETVTAKVEESLAEISDITSIIDRFRSFARKSSAASVTSVDVETVAMRITQLLDESAKRARIALHIKDMHEHPPVHINERDFEQLIFALVQNAIQAADGERPRELVISGHVRDRSLELRFTDNCGGIAPEDLNRVLDPFFTTKPPGQGTGLGLCIVQQIASRAGGKVTVDSDFGKGSTFIVTLPIERNRPL